MMPAHADPRDAHSRDVLRQASAALSGRVVTLWELSSRAEVAALASSVPDPDPRDVALDLDETIARWGVPLIEGSRWVGCRLDDRRWCLAPVRTHPAPGPPGPGERRRRARLILELTGLCLGLLARPTPARRPRLPETEAMRALARHPSVIAHEVGNRLGAALVHLDLGFDAARAVEGLESSHRTQLVEALTGVGQWIEQGLAYLRSIQDQARGELARVERFDAVQVVRSCITLERPLVRKAGVTISWDTDLESVYLQGDPNGLYRILAQLIRNAADAAGRRESVVTVTLEHAGGVLRLAVRDQGVGIAPEHLGRVFEPGFTTKPFGAGAGLGLTVVRELTRALGGEVSVDSRVGVGTVVMVSLPIPPQRGARPGPGPLKDLRRPMNDS